MLDQSNPHHPPSKICRPFYLHQSIGVPRSFDALSGSQLLFLNYVGKLKLGFLFIDDIGVGKLVDSISEFLGIAL